MKRGTAHHTPVPIHALDLASWIREGDFIVWGQGAAEPTTLVRALLSYASCVKGLRAFVGMSFADTLQFSEPPPLHLMSYCATGRNAKLVNAGWMDIWPGAYAVLPDFLGEQIDVLLLSVSEPNPLGEMSLGLAHEYLIPLIDRASVIIAEINPAVPFTYGARLLKLEECSAIIESHAEVPELPSRAPNPNEIRIASHVADLIQDGATLQTGIGSLPDAIMSSLKSRRDLGLHTGMATESSMILYESGALTNARKQVDTGVSVAGMALGSHALYRFLHENSAFSFRSTLETHDVERIRTIEKFVAINSALEVDITGQINAEAVGNRYLGAVGGAGSFLRGAALSHGGLPIVALPSTSSKDGHVDTRIVSRLNGPVSTARVDAGLIVTEYGVADLRNKTLRQRRDAMIAIAAPQFRDTLDTSTSINF